MLLVVLQIPTSWRSVLEDPSTLQVFFDYYAITKAPLSKEVSIFVLSQRTFTFASFFVLFCQVIVNDLLKALINWMIEGKVLLCQIWSNIL